MNAAKRIAPGRSLLSVREAAWALGVDQSVVCRAIRRGVLPLVKRRGRAVVPVAAVTRLLCHAATTPGSRARPRDAAAMAMARPSGRRCVMSARDDGWLAEIARRLARLRRVPTGVLAEIVAGDGACMEVSADDGPPRWLHRGRHRPRVGRSALRGLPGPAGVPGAGAADVRRADRRCLGRAG